MAGRSVARWAELKADWLERRKVDMMAEPWALLMVAQREYPLADMLVYQRVDLKVLTMAE